MIYTRTLKVDKSNYFENKYSPTKFENLIKNKILISVLDCYVEEIKTWGRKKKLSYINHMKDGKTEEESYQLVKTFKQRTQQ